MPGKQALLIIDVQNDFCPGGALAVPAGDDIVPQINKYIHFLALRGIPVLCSRDWHPEKSDHFNKWPVHCVQNTIGARFHPGLKFPPGTVIFSKGMDPKEDGYSAFQGKDKGGASLLNFLNKRGVTELFVAGLATEYCVKATVLDALKYGLHVNVLIDAVKGIDLKPGESAAAVKEMISCGAKGIRYLDLSLGSTNE